MKTKINKVLTYFLYWYIGYDEKTDSFKYGNNDSYNGGFFYFM